MRNYVILFSFLTSHLFATTFAPVTIQQQIQESKGVVQGEVVSVGSQRDPELGIVTKVFIRADRWMDAPVSANHIEVFFPGGIDGDDQYLVHGAPEFKAGERVVVFTSKHKGKSWVQNLGLGKFSVKKLGKSEVLVNQIFPNIPNVGQMPLKKFVRMAKDLKGKDFKRRYKDKYERAAEKARTYSYRKKGKASRRIASSAKAPHKKPHPLWLVLLLGILGASFRFSKGRKSR